MANEVFTPYRVVTEQVPNVAPRRFGPDERLHYYIRIHLESGYQSLPNYPAPYPSAVTAPSGYSGIHTAPAPNMAGSFPPNPYPNVAPTVPSYPTPLPATSGYSGMPAPYAPQTFSLDDIDLVVYVLDQSFGNNRFVVSDDRFRSFQIFIWTFGFSQLNARVILKRNAVVNVVGEVRWNAIPYSTPASGY